MPGPLTAAVGAAGVVNLSVIMKKSGAYTDLRTPVNKRQRGKSGCDSSCDTYQTDMFSAGGLAKFETSQKYAA